MSAIGEIDEEVWELLAGSAGPSEETPAVTLDIIPERPAVREQERPTQTVSELQSCTAGPGCCKSSSSSAQPSPSDARRDVKPKRIAGKVGQIPADILEDPSLNEAIANHLPSLYNFEVHKTIWRLRRAEAQHVGIQLPEGLTRWATTLADILRSFASSVQTTTILGDVSYGACCIDDLGCRALGVDFLIHYGHSCIVPVDQTAISVLYVHVEVRVDVDHLVETIRLNFDPSKRLALMGSVQFTAGVKEAVTALSADFFEDGGGSQVPQVKPLGLGETLGCTSPVVSGADAVVFVCDGRFHLESAMIQNPHVKDGFFRYDPFAKTLTKEGYAYDTMHGERKQAIASARNAQCVGLILSTLGRQGSIGVLEEVERLLEKRGIDHFTLLLADVVPHRLARFTHVGAWVQVACPRLSLDWGAAYSAPLLTPYEAHVAFGDTQYKDVYPMDYYSNKGGPWSNYGAHNGYGGSLGEKFRHLRPKKHTDVEYDN